MTLRSTVDMLKNVNYYFALKFILMDFMFVNHEPITFYEQKSY